MYNLLCEKISSQQGEKGTAVYMVGQQLKDICRNAGNEVYEIVLKDLDLKEMSLAECEKQIKAHADKIHKEKKGNCVCVSPAEAEDIIKKFYGIDGMLNSQTVEKVDTSNGFVNLADFL